MSGREGVYHRIYPLFWSFFPRIFQKTCPISYYLFIYLGFYVHLQGQFLMTFRRAASDDDERNARRTSHAQCSHTHERERESESETAISVRERCDRDEKCHYENVGANHLDLSSKSRSLFSLRPRKYAYLCEKTYISATNVCRYAICSMPIRRFTLGSV